MPRRRSRQYVGDGGSQRPAGMRAFWSGTITFGLVSVPVDLFSATRGRGRSLRMLDEDGTPLRRQYVCPEDGEALSSDELIRGYEAEDGEMIVVTDEELESLAPEKSRDIALIRFVDRAAIPPIYFQRAYFLAPAGSSSRAYQLLARTMEENDKVGLATFVMRGVEYLVAIIAEGGVLRAETLRFADELRGWDEVALSDAEADRSTVKRMRAAIKKATKKLDPDELHDAETERLLALVERKRDEGSDVVETEAAGETGGGEVIDLMKELKKRLAGEPAPRTRSATSSGDLEEMTKKELYERAQKLDIEGRSKMSKKQLIAAIRKAG